MPTTPQAKTRFSCKCKLCKAKWTTDEADRSKAYAKHGETCEKYQVAFARRRAAFPSCSVESEQYQISCFCFEHMPIRGHFNAEVKCDARCTGATGHNCECSCGGANHGMGRAA